MRRAFVIVLDACGVGELPDSAEYGDAGVNTLGHLAQVAGGLDLAALGQLGLGSILPLEGVPPAERPVIHGSLAPLGPGKDSTAGHWELMGVVMPAPPPVYPDGFPEEVLAVITRAAGREILCNRPFNGLEVLEHYGAEQLRTGRLIVYTSQDSVLQIAAHEDIVPPEELREICRHVRESLESPHRVGRVIARPFTGPPGAFRRTAGRHDYAIAPPSRSYLQEIQDASIPVHAVGKAGPLFKGIGVDVQHAGPDNETALNATTELIDELEHGCVFTNLIDTDQVHGHRHDAAGFHGALRQIDARVGEWLARLGEDDLLILTADHGCDITAAHTDHTRERVPLLARAPGHRGRRHDGAMADVGASVLDWLTGGTAAGLPGSSFLREDDA